MLFHVVSLNKELLKKTLLCSNKVDSKTNVRTAMNVFWPGNGLERKTHDYW